MESVRNRHFRRPCAAGMVAAIAGARHRRTTMLQGKTAIVTGSTRGIGLGIADPFARAGANIVLNGFGEAMEIERLRCDMSKRTGAKVVYSPADMSKARAIENMVRQTAETFGAVDILVNNAGIQHVAPIEEFPEEKWD